MAVASDVVSIERRVTLSIFGGHWNEDERCRAVVVTNLLPAALIYIYGSDLTYSCSSCRLLVGLVVIIG
jgi:hypothetical protein